ncbi:hypothetical protein C5167_014855 [Papaver somniferum]|uniref:RRM domain-containing protein n=1 Tax=Papaver somniferum TaxID=3469 RepID=A0A4Y7J7H0_PAPSO|nr:hypothetical protein C5167_014855 [Papaver somniferum]
MEEIMIHSELDKEEKGGGEEAQLRFQILSNSLFTVEIDMTNKGNYKRNKTKRAKLMKDKARGLHTLRRCESSHSSAHDNRRQRSRSPRACSGLVTPTSTIVVKGLPKEATEEMIYRILAEWRPLPNIRVMPKKNTTFCCGIAFVDFPSVVAARKLMDEIGDRGLDVNGRKLSFDYRLGKSELANEVPIVNAGIGESEVAGEHEDENDSEDDEEDCDYVDEVASKRLPDSWDPEEIHMLREAFHYLVKDGKKKPWKEMLEYGHDVFHAGRTNEDLRSKWKYMVNHGQW